MYVGVVLPDMRRIITGYVAIRMGGGGWECTYMSGMEGVIARSGGAERRISDCSLSNPRMPKEVETI